MNRRFATNVVAALVTLAAGTAACTKTIDKTSVTDNSIAGVYKVTALLFKDVNGNQADLYASLPPCQKDNLQKLNADHTFQLLDGCDPVDNESGNWQLNSNQRITINGVTADILSYDARSLVIAVPGFMGMPGTVTETLTRQ